MLADPQAARQFAAEYSQSSYVDMLCQDYAIGDYIARLPQEPSAMNGGVKFTYTERERLISIIQDLHKRKEYKHETLHLAGSVADRYVCILISEGLPVPNLFALAAACVLIAAKIE